MLIAHLSDLHICADTAGSDTNVYTRQAVECLMRLPVRPDIVVVTGDIGEGSRDDYALLAGCFEPLSMPVYMIPGNHDDREVMRSALMPHGYMPASGPLDFVVETRPVRIIGLDSLIPGQVEGALSDHTLEFLERTLATEPSTPAVILIHHPPFQCGISEKDSIRLFEGADRFAEILSEHRQVERVLSGHHHRLLLGRVSHTICQVAPPVRYQETCGFDAGRPNQEVELPGFLLHRWIDGVGIATQHCPLNTAAQTA